jgi:WD40 repeat protein
MHPARLFLIVLALLSVAIIAGLASTAAGDQPWFPVVNLSGQSTVADLAVGPDWTLYSVGGNALNDARKWDLRNGSSIALNSSGYGSPQAIAFGPRDRVAFGVWSETLGPQVVLLEMENQTEIGRINVSQFVSALAWIDEDSVAVGTEAGDVSIFSTAGVLERSVGAGIGWVEFVAVSPAHAVLAAGTRYGQVTVWSVSTGQIVYNVSDQYSMFVAGVFMDALQEFVYLETSGNVHWVSMAPYAETRSIHYAGAPQSLGVVASTSEILIGFGTGPFLRSVSAQDGRYLWNDTLFYGTISVIVVSPDGVWFATGSTQGTISIWAKQRNPWDAPAPTPVAPIVEIVAPPTGAIVDGGVDARGTVSPLSSARAVLWAIDNGTARSANGTDNWTFFLLSAGLADGYHELEVWAAGETIVGRAARVGFFVPPPSPPAPGPVEIFFTFPANNSTVSPRFSVGGELRNWTPNLGVVVRLEDGQWSVANLSSGVWVVEMVASLSPGVQARLEAKVIGPEGTVDAEFLWIRPIESAEKDEVPQVSLLAPASGSIVNGTTLSVRGLTFDDQPGAFTIVSLDNWTVVAVSRDEEWEFSFNVLGFSLGEHVVWAEAYDASGQRNLTATMWLLVPDDRAVTVHFLSPTNNSEIAGGLELIVVIESANAPTGTTAVVYLDSAVVYDGTAENLMVVRVPGSMVSIEGHQLRVVLRKANWTLASDSISLNAAPPIAVVDTRIDWAAGILLIGASGGAGLAIWAARRRHGAGHTPSGAAIERDSYGDERGSAQDGGPRARQRRSRHR